MLPVEIKKDIYWVGSMDYSMRSFHGYSTEKGSTYNAYLIMDEKITLIDTVKAPFCLEMLGRIRNIVDPAKIDYIVSNHVEPDHSGGIPFMSQQCPNAKIITSDPNGLKGLTGRYGEKDYITVKAGDTLSLGINALAGLKISMIATGHGVSWRTNIEDIIKAYQDWSSFQKTDKAVVVFDTMWHTTEIMAKNVADAFYHIGIKPVLFDLRCDHISDVMTELLDAKYIAVGSPTLNNNMMPSIAGFLCYMKGLAPKGLKGFAFGSYGWGGQSIGQVENALKDCKVEICLDMQKILNTPNPKLLKDLQNAVMGLKEA